MQWKLFTNRYKLPLLFLDILFSAYCFSDIKRRKRIIYIGQDYKKMLSTGDFYFDKRDFKISGSRILNFILTKPAKAEKLITSCIKEGSSLINYANQIENKNFKYLSKEEILEIWQNIKNKYQDFAFWIILPQTADAHLEQYLREKIIRPKIKKNQSNLTEDKILSILIQSLHKTFVELEEEDLLKLVYWIKTNKLPLNNNPVKKKINHHLSKYAWINTHLWAGEAYSYSDLIKRIRENLPKVELELNKTKQKKKSAKKEFETIIRQLKFLPKELRIIKIIQDIVFMRTYRSDILSMTGFKFRSFFKFIAKKFDVEFKDLMYLNIAEFEQAIKEWILPDKIKREIRKRQTKPFVYYWLKDKQKIEYKSISKKKTKDIKVIRGKIAYQGKAKGIVKLVKGNVDFKKVKQDDILVTGMTSPDFVPVLKKVNGFITDEGGITCHAAIISRELKIPCIIGARIATKVLKDGDFVEIDADNGVVKVVKKR